MDVLNHTNNLKNTTEMSSELFRKENYYNLLLDTDSYKFSHWLQYPEDSAGYFGYVESRGGLYPETLFFGLQYLLKKYLSTRITKEDIIEAEQFSRNHGEPFNKAGWEKIFSKYGGYLPLKISAAPEGLVIPIQNALVTIESTDEDLFWLPSFLETMILRNIWYPTTVATISYNIKKLLIKYHTKTADSLDAVMFSLHDFGARGVSSFESSAIGGAAHLVNFLGSDTVSGVRLANQCYGVGNGMAAFSIPAAEHSTITSWGRENESKAYENMITKYGKKGCIFAVVSDSYNIYNAVDKIWGEELKNKVVESGATLVVRPDSGDPVEVVTKCIQILADKFGYTYNRKGFKVLKTVKVIQGDGVCYESIKAILDSITSLGFCASNVAFGMGGALLQKLDRDTQKFALKCSAILRNGGWYPVYKDPVTDSVKKSKSGKLQLYRDKTTGEYITSSPLEYLPNNEPILKTVFKNGEILHTYTLDEIRKNTGL